MQVTLNKLHSVHPLEVETESEEQAILRQIAQGDRTAFWQLWQQYHDYLYRRCWTWMGGNHMEAEEALSQAMLKAWNKMPKYAEQITNPKAWLTRMTHNLCVDIHRERQRKAKSSESLETIADGEDEAITSGCDSPESVLLHLEMQAYIRRAVNALPVRLRQPFILRFEQEKSYQEIAEQLALSHHNVRKRIQQAREILQKYLNKYFAGLDRSGLEDSETPTTCDSEELIVDERIVEQINYKVTASCLEILSHTWYRSFGPLGWR